MELLPIIVIEMILASALAIVLYWWDKRIARKNAGSAVDPTGSTLPSKGIQSRPRRIPERTLLILCLLGGWPGAWWASQKFRHKTQKRSFRIKFWISVALNVSIIAVIAFRWASVNHW